jgi:hypothetical protein
LSPVGVAVPPVVVLASTVSRIDTVTVSGVIHSNLFRRSTARPLPDFRDPSVPSSRSRLPTSSSTAWT